MTEATSKYAEIISKCCADPEFKAQLLSDPVAVLNSVGVKVGKGVDVKVLEETESTRYFVIPMSSDTLDDALLAGVAGGAQNMTFSDGKTHRLPTGDGQNYGRIEVEGDGTTLNIG